MTIKKELMKIERISFGLGGYQDAQIGIHIAFSGRGGIAVSTSEGYWDCKRSSNCKWTEADRIQHLGGLVMKISGWLRECGVHCLNDLKGKPVEVTFDGNSMKSWRFLTEVL